MTMRVLLLGIALSLVGRGIASAEEPIAREKLRETLLEREKESWELLKKKDVAAMRAFYPDDLVMISGDGSRYGKPEFLKVAPDVNLTEYKFEGKPEVVVLNPDSAILVYRVVYTMGIKDAKPKTVTMMTSSTYVRRDRKWALVFNQETPAK